MHREQMRVMDDFIEDNGLKSELEATVIEETGNTGFWLGLDDGSDGLDEDSDAEDPEAVMGQQVRALRQELADQRAFVAAVKGALGHSAMARELERARMQLEDHRAQGLR